MGSGSMDINKLNRFMKMYKRYYPGYGDGIMNTLEDDLRDRGITPVKPTFWQQLKKNFKSLLLIPF